MLRHDPSTVGIELDQFGWTDLFALISALRRRSAWTDLLIEEVEALVREQTVNRFEVESGRIRALYGHSLKHISSGVLQEPPPLLFHATRAAYFTAIRVNGIAPRSRSHAHLTTSLTYALSVKAEHERAGSPGILFGVQTKKAFVPFYKATDLVWTAPFVPPSALVLVIPDSSPLGYQVLSPSPSNSALSLEQDMAFYASLLRDEIDGE